MPERHKVVLIELHDLALRHEPVMLKCRSDWDVPIAGAMNDQHRATILRQDRSQPALIGVVEVSGVFDSKGRLPEEAKVRKTVLQRPKGT